MPNTKENNPLEIRQKKVLIVEGKDEVDFFNALLKYMEITSCEIHKVDGKGNFKTRLSAIVKAAGFKDNVEAFAVIRDADENAHGAFESIKNILKRLNLSVPYKANNFSNGVPRVGIFIMPGNSENGMLEDLCLKTVTSHPAIKRVNCFMECVATLEEPPHNMSKAKTLAFLATMPETSNCIGRAAEKGYWNFDCAELDDLKAFLENLR